MENLFIESEETVYIEIVGDPICDLYDDDGWIQYDVNEFYGQVNDKLSDEVTRQNTFLLVDGINLKQGNSRFGSCGASWAFVKGDPVQAFTHHRDKEEHMDISFMIITLFTAQVDFDEICHHCLLVWQEYCHWMLRNRRNKLIEDHG